MCVFACAGRKDRQGHKSRTVYLPLSPDHWKYQHWCPTIWINGDLHCWPFIWSAIIIYPNNGTILSFSFWYLAPAGNLCRQITLVTLYILYYIIMKEITYKWLASCILYSLVNSYNGTCHVVTTFKKGHQHVEKFIRPSGRVNRSAEEAKGKRILIQHSAQASLQWWECRVSQHT